VSAGEPGGGVDLRLLERLAGEQSVNQRVELWAVAAEQLGSRRTVMKMTE